MTETAFESLADLCRPPEGYVFSCGIWLTYDLDWQTVTDDVLPLLAGVSSPDPVRRRRQAWGLLAPPHKPLLVVLAAARHVQPGPVAPWARYFEVGGRPLHAKAGLVQFRYEAGTKCRTRAFVTSANLTSGGLRTNRELVMAEELGGQSQTRCLASDLTEAIDGLLKSASHDLAAAGRSKVREALKRIVDGAPKGSATGSVVHSLTAPRLLTDAFGPPTFAARRAVIVTPAYASTKDTRAATLLARHLGPDTELDLYTGADLAPGEASRGARAPRFSAGALEVLRRSTKVVRVWAVPEAADASAPGRVLHAKLVALDDGEGTVRILAGSANFTRRGLTGLNRELAVLLHRPSAWVDDIAFALDAVEHTGEVLPPVRPSVDPGTLPSPPDVIVLFRIEPGQAADSKSWWGRIVLKGADAHRVVAIHANGKAVDPDGPIRVAEARGWVVLVVADLDGRRHRVRLPLVVDAPAQDPGFWQGVAAEEPERRSDPLLERLRRDLQRSHQPKGPVAAPPTKVGDHDGYAIPLRQRLVVLARYRSGAAASLLEDHPEEDLRQWVEDHEVPVALTLLGLPVKQMSPLLAGLAQAVAAIDEHDQ